MNSTSSILSSIKPGTDPGVVDRAAVSEIDRSVKTPALLFFLASLFWLVVGTLLALTSAFKLHHPEFLGNHEWLTFGRVRAAHLNTMVYGWSICAAVGVALWIMARLSKAPVRHGSILVTGAVLWNIGVAAGVVAILKGDSTSIEWLEIPHYITPVLFIALALIGIWGIITFRFRQSSHVYVSQWYILAAFFWLPWIYSVAQIMLVFEPARGTVQSLVNWWFARSLLGLWFSAIGLASIYYFLPKVLGKPIHSYYLSVLGFWSFALFYSWAGTHHLIGGPVPVWVISAGIVASVMMVIPVVVVAINHHLTLAGSFAAMWRSPTLRFTVFGAVAYTVVSLQGTAMALRTHNEITHFTHYTVAHAHLGMYAFFTMVMFGAFYYILPRLLYREWPSATLIHIHFWMSAVGITIYVVGLGIGGVIQGFAMNNPDIPFLDVVSRTIPWLMSRSVGGILITAGHIAFVAHVAWIFGSPVRKSDEGPTLFEQPKPVKGPVT